MATSFRPLKAPSKGIPDSFIPKLKFPLYGSPKLDGLRALNREGKAVTSSLKPVSNRHTNKLMSNPLCLGFDGEITVGDGDSPIGFSKATSAMMAAEGTYDIIWHVFDLQDIAHDMPYVDRLQELKRRVEAADLSYIRLVPQVLLFGINELIEYEKEILKLGFEGVMLRSVDGRYKWDRSTMNEQILLKLKRGHEKRDDAVVVGFSEQMQNNNPPYINERGLQQRAQNKEFMVGKNTLGAFLVRDESGREFSIGGGIEGAGFDDAFRKQVWENKDKWLGQTIRYQWFDYGGYELPRFPKYVGKRAPEDITA